METTFEPCLRPRQIGLVSVLGLVVASMIGCGVFHHQRFFGKGSTEKVVLKKLNAPLPILY